MFRFILYRACWAAILMGAGATQLAALPVLPVTMDRTVPMVAALLFILASILIQATLPLIPLFRRSVDSEVDALLADLFSHVITHHGRPVWLQNPNDKMVRGQPWRFQFLALLSMLIGVSWVLMQALLAGADWIPVIALTALVAIGSTAVIEASVGNSAGPAVGYLMAASVTGPLPLETPPVGALGRMAFTFTLVFFCVWALWGALHLVRQSRWSPLSNACRNTFDRWWLRAEMWLPLCFVTRFVHGGPAMVRELRSTNPYWDTVITTLLQRARHAVVDISKIEPTSATAWEVKTCYGKNVKLLLTCHAPERERAVACLRALLPDAVILPDDFFNAVRLKKLAVPGTLPVQIFDYEDQGALNPFIAQAGVFFGDVSLEDWHAAVLQTYRPTTALR